MVGELRFHIPKWPKSQSIKQKQCCNKLNTLKMVHIKKKKKERERQTDREERKQIGVTMSLRN